MATLSVRSRSSGSLWGGGSTRRGGLQSRGRSSRRRRDPVQKLVSTVNSRFKFHNDAGGTMRPASSKAYKPNESVIKSTIQALFKKMAPRNVTVKEKAARRIIATVTRDYMLNLNHPLTNNDISELEELLAEEVWRAQIDPGSALAKPGEVPQGPPSPFYHFPATRNGGNPPSQRSSSSLPRVPSASGSRMTGRSGYNGSGTRRSLASSGTARITTARAREAVEEDPVLALQMFYKLLKQDKVVQAKAKEREEVHKLQQALQVQIVEAERAKKQQEEEDMKLFQSELQKAAEFEARVKAQEAARREARIAEFKQRELDRRRVLVAREAEKQRERELERREAQAAAAEARRVEEAKKRKKAQDRVKLVASLDKEAARIRALRAQDAAEANRTVDPEEVERAAAKIQARIDMVEKRKQQYIKDNIKRQEHAARATLKFAAPLEAKRQHQSECEDKWVQQQIKVWKDDLQARQEHKEKLERERLATITKQIKEKELKDKKAAEERERYAAHVRQGATGAGDVDEGAKQAAARREALHRAELMKQIRENEKAKPRTTFEKMDEMTRADFDELVSNKEMMRRIKAEMDKMPRKARVAAAGLMP